MLLPQLLRAGSELPGLLYAAFISLATLGLAWLFDDRGHYRLQYVMNLEMPKASSRERPNTGINRSREAASV
jgi:hypothetical protein